MRQANQLGWWIQGEDRPRMGHDAVNSAIQEVGKPVYIIRTEGRIGVAQGGGHRQRKPAGRQSGTR